MMAKDNKEKAKELFTQGMKLIDIAKKLDIPPGTVRRWKSVQKWGERSNKANNKSERSVKKKKKGSKKLIIDEVKQVLDNPELNDKQRLFCLYYVRYFSATKAYQKAYEVDYKTAASISYRLMDKDGIKDEIYRLKQGRLNKTMLEPEDIFQKYMDIAFADITDYLQFGREEVPVMGAFGPIEVKDNDTGEKTTLTKVVNTVRFKESGDIDGTIISEVKQGKDGASIKLHDRMKALQWLTDHMNMATEEQKARIEALKRQAKDDTADENNTGVILMPSVLPEEGEPDEPK